MARKMIFSLVAALFVGALSLHAVDEKAEVAAASKPATVKEATADKEVAAAPKKVAAAGDNQTQPMPSTGTGCGGCGCDQTKDGQVKSVPQTAPAAQPAPAPKSGCNSCNKCK